MKVVALAVVALAAGFAGLRAWARRDEQDREQAITGSPWSRHG